METTNSNRSRIRTWLIVAVLGLLVAFLLGFIPQFRKASQLQLDLRAREDRIDQLQREASLSKARDLASLVYLQLVQKNYGIAAQHATALFDQLRVVMNDTADQPRKSVIQDMLNQRDAIVASIAKPDAAVETQVRDILERLHRLTLR